MSIEIVKREESDIVSEPEGDEEGGYGIEIVRSGRPVKSGEGTVSGGYVYLLIDCSSSMAGGKLEDAKLGVVDFATSALRTRYKVGLIGFSSYAQHHCDPQGNIAGIKEYLDGMYPGGSTNMSAAIAEATERLKEFRGGSKAMVIATDGMPDRSRETLEEAEKAKSLGIDIITIGTDDADRNFLGKLASRQDLSQMVSRSNFRKAISSAVIMLPSGRPMIKS